MCPPSVEGYTEAQQRGVQRALDILDRLDARLERHYSVVRKHPRRAFRGTALVRLVSSDPDEKSPEIRVFTRSISESGVSFLCPKSLARRRMQIGLEPAPGRAVWFKTELVRCREVAGEGFWEHGVAFRGRVADCPAVAAEV